MTGADHADAGCRYGPTGAHFVDETLAEDAMVCTPLPARWETLCRGLSIRGRAGAPPGQARVSLRGEVHVCCERALEGVFVDLVDAGVTSLNIDLADVVFVDGAGARTLALTAQKLEAGGGRLRVGQPAASATALLEMTGLGRLLASPK